MAEGKDDPLVKNSVYHGSNNELSENIVEDVDNQEQETSPVSQYDIDQKLQRKLIRRIDFRLLPWLALMYSISFVDRTNLGLALVAGLQQQLDLQIGDRYTIIVMIFFIAYILFELPSNVVLQRVGCANWLTFLGVSFGCVLIGMGFAKHWGTLALCRALLGAFEAGFSPGCAYLITCWYYPSVFLLQVMGDFNTMLQVKLTECLANIGNVGIPGSKLESALLPSGIYQFWLLDLVQYLLTSCHYWMENKAFLGGLGSSLLRVR